MDAQGLREYISNLEVRTDMLEIDFHGLDVLVDEVVVHFDMFSPGVEHGVVSEVDVAHIVADVNEIRKGNT